MYKENHSPPNQHPSLPHILLLFLATVDCFPVTARIDELLLTETLVKYCSLDKTLQITEKTLLHCLQRYVGSAVSCGLVPDRNANPQNMNLFNMPHLVGRLNLIPIFGISSIMCDCQFGEE